MITNSLNKPLSMGCRALALAAASALMMAICQAQVITLTDRGSTAVVDLGSSAGMNQWTVTGLPAGMENQLHQQWFWYRINGGLAQPVNTIGPAVYSFDPNVPNLLSATYANADVSVTIKYTLTGGGIGQADISEGLTLQNLHPASAFDFHFYQYSDFNLLNNPAGDSVQMVNDYVAQWKGDTSIQEAIIAPEANYFEANFTGGADSTLNRLNTIPSLNLNDNPEALNGDVTWAFQWDFMNLGTATIQKDKLLSVSFVPEPPTFAFVALGLAALLLRRHARA